MSNIGTIELKNLKKVYKIYKKPMYRIMDSLFNTKNYSEYHALNGITMKIEKGEAVGILGKNGAGKSTLLKIITGVATQTDGEVNINGKISAILELNSGFDEELTGYENIFVKGLIMGYTKAEIKEKVDEIIKFAAIGKHIYQPVRTYSSGMKSRLGFAIAVNVDPDILIVDEALSVGDEVFKTKCLNKMSEFRKSGKTILFVSHSIFTIKAFCTKAAWIKDGVLMDYGDMGEVVQKYETFLKEEKARELKVKEEEEGLERKDYIGISNFKFNDNKKVFKYGEDISFSFEYNVKKPLDALRWTFTIRDADDKEIYSTDKMSDDYLIDNSLGVHPLFINLKDMRLLPGKYKLSGELRNETGIVYVGYANKKIFEIEQHGKYVGSGVCLIEHEKINRWDTSE